jgi:GNAT superfamily N-acetyltransferase
MNCALRCIRARICNGAFRSIDPAQLAVPLNLPRAAGRMRLTVRSVLALLVGRHDFDSRNVPSAIFWRSRDSVCCFIQPPIVNALRRTGKLVGHVVVSPVSISDGTPDWFGLGPMSVLPEHQRHGVGSRLMPDAGHLAFRHRVDKARGRDLPALMGGQRRGRPDRARTRCEASDGCGRQGTGHEGSCTQAALSSKFPPRAQEASGPREGQCPPEMIQPIC